MRFIDKRRCVAPAEITRVLSRVQATSWDSWRGDKKRQTVEALAASQGYVCAYCESRLVPAAPPREESACHGEHIVPISHPSGAGRQFDWDNLVASCRKEFAQGEAKYCGHARGDWYEEMMFVHPLDVRCESAFVFSALGEVSPAAGEMEAAAQETITRLGLNDSRLVQRRRDALSAYIGMLFLDGVSPDVSELRALRDALESPVGGRHEPHRTTLMQELERLLAAA